MNRLRLCTLLFVALTFAVAPNILAGQAIPVHTNPAIQMLEGPVPWPPPGVTVEGPVPWPGPGLVRG